MTDMYKKVHAKYAKEGAKHTKTIGKEGKGRKGILLHNFISRESKC